jgi:hypothetical protein
MVNGDWETAPSLRPHYQLDAWKEAIQLVKHVYRLTQSFPKDDAQGHHPRRRLRHPPVPRHPGGVQAAAADLRQAHDLSPAHHPHAGGHPRHPDHLHPPGHAPLRAAARRRRPVGAEPGLRRAAQPGRPGPGLRHRRRFHRRCALRPGAGRQHLLRPRDGPGPARRQRPGQRRHGVRLPGARPGALRRGGVRRPGPGRQPGGKAQGAEVQLRRHRPVFLRQPGGGRGPRPEALPPGRTGNHRRQPAVPGLGRTQRRHHGPRAMPGSTPAPTNPCWKPACSSRPSRSARASRSPVRKRSPTARAISTGSRWPVSPSP